MDNLNPAIPVEEDEEEDDYMNMNFDEPAPVKETSLQRVQRLKRESKARGTIKSKAELDEEEKLAREKALSTSLLDDPRSKKSKGLSMMAKMGFTGGGLGKKTEDGASKGRIEPITLSMKDDRGGVGMDNEKKRKILEAVEERGIKAVKVDPDEYRERVRKEREEARLEKQFHAAQRMAERMDDGEGLTLLTDGHDDQDDQDESPQEQKDNNAKSISSRPLKSINILYRGLVRHREEQERDRRMRYDLEQSLSRLPTYEDDHEDEDDKRALGKTKTIYVMAEDLDEEDDDLDKFNALEPGERLQRVLVYLRQQHQYCFWCKMGYPDKDMEGCPGENEDDHD